MESELHLVLSRIRMMSQSALALFTERSVSIAELAVEMMLALSRHDDLWVLLCVGILPAGGTAIGATFFGLGLMF